MKSSAFCLYCGKPGGDSIVKHPKTAPFRVRAQGEKTGEQAKMKNLRECVTRFICATVDRNEITLHLIENMKTITEIRKSFWGALNPDFASHRRSRKRQNQYDATIRSAFCDYVDGLQKSGKISEKLADRATL